MGENYGRTNDGELIGPYETSDELERELASANAAIAAPTWLVIESTPGYMPDADEPADFTEYSDAVAYANELADELEEQGYVCDRSWASSGNYYAVHCERAPLTADEREELTRLEHAFEESGGRGVELADRIDSLRARDLAAPDLGRFIAVEREN